MAVVNVNLNNMLNVKDSRWLQLEVCREFQRSKCSRSDCECKFAHPPANVEVQNGRVIACYDSIKGRCNREKPPCKYFHPPQHLKDQLLINGRNHLALKNALMLQMSMGPGQSVLPGPTLDYTEFRPVRCIPSSVHDWCEMSQASPYLAGIPQLSAGGYSHYSPMLQVVSPEAAVSSQLGVVPTGAGYGAPANKLQRSDRIEAYPGMMPYKRSAGDKSGMTAIYQQSANSSAAAAAAAAAAYQAQALMQLQQPYMPVSCEYTGAAISSTCSSGLVTTTSTFSSSASNASSSTTPSSSSTSTNLTTSSTSATNTSVTNTSSSSIPCVLSSAGYTAGQVLSNGSASYEHLSGVHSSTKRTVVDESASTGDQADSSECDEQLISSKTVVTGLAMKRPRSPSNQATAPGSSLIALAPPSALMSHPHPHLAAHMPYASTSSGLHFPQALQSQTALAYTGVSLNKQLSSTSSSSSNAAVPSALSAGAAPMGFPSSLSAIQHQYQQYLNPYYSLVQQNAAPQAFGVNSPYATAFGSNQLVNNAAGLQAAMQQQSAVAAAAAAAAQTPAAQQLAALQGLQQSMNPAASAGLAAYLPAANSSLGMFAGFNPMSSSMPQFNPALMHQYMSLGGVRPGAPNIAAAPSAAAAAAAAAAAMANAGLPAPYKKMRTI